MALIPSVVALAAILVFVVQNTQRTKVSFLGFSGHAPLGVALIAAALLGAIAVFGLGSVRILQLRRAVRRMPNGGDRSS